MRRARVTAFGASSVNESDVLYAEIKALGRCLAEHHWDGSTGGHQGLMAAFSEGMHAGGGHVRGIMLDRFPSPPESTLAEEVRASGFFDRMQMLIEDADAWLVLPGGLGTLAEFAMCWDLAAIRVLEQRPLIVYGKMWNELLPVLQDALLLSAPDALTMVRPCETMDEVLAALADVQPD